MTTVRFQPHTGFGRMFAHENCCSPAQDKAAGYDAPAFRPRIDINEDKNAIYLYLEIPGLSKEEVNISVNEERKITIKGEKKRQEDERTILRSERIYGNFERAFILPEYTDLEKIAARFDNGVLEISIQKKEPEQPKEVEISING
ncbi:MAG: Molecular chaperone (small heat shock protein) [Ignavibacteria bacterium]|nr:Molecular chaperone (small heat shock protein) [Ignavibacteria bacterium]